MAEQQLIDYIQKARAAGQSDDQSKTLLVKNGWTDTEISEALASMNQSQPQSQPEPKIIQPDAQPEPQMQYKPEPQIQPQVNSMESSMPTEKRGMHLVLNIIIVLIILVILGGAGYFVLGQQNMLKGLVNQFMPTPVVIKPVTPSPIKTVVKVETSVVLSTNKIATVSGDYDLTKMTVMAFSKAGDKVAFCLPAKADGKFACFVNNDQQVNSYAYKPSAILFSPDGKRTVLIYSDPVTKQSFIFENGQEGTKYDGTISGPKFSDNSQNLMFIVNGKDGKSFVVLNGTSYTPHDKVYGTPTLSSDGKYLLYGARDGQDFFWVADPIVNASK